MTEFIYFKFLLFCLIPLFCLIILIIFFPCLLLSFSYCFISIFHLFWMFTIVVIFFALLKKAIKLYPLKTNKIIVFMFYYVLVLFQIFIFFYCLPFCLVKKKPSYPLKTNKIIFLMYLLVCVYLFSILRHFLFCL